MKAVTDAVAAILVGGSSRRMGADKALVVVEGLPMIERVASAAEPVCGELIAVGRSEPLMGLRSIPDPSGYRSSGALLGLVAGLAHSSPRSLLLLAVDQPFMRTDTLKRLVELFEDVPLVPVDQGIRQVTCAVYPSSLLDEANAELRAEGSIQSLLDRVPHEPVGESVWTTWGEDGRSWFSVDTGDALREGLERFGTATG